MKQSIMLVVNISMIVIRCLAAADQQVIMVDSLHQGEVMVIMAMTGIVRRIADDKNSVNARFSRDFHVDLCTTVENSDSWEILRTITGVVLVVIVTVCLLSILAVLKLLGGVVLLDLCAEDVQFIIALCICCNHELL